MKLGFMMNRILRMSPPEIVYRFGQRLQTKIENAKRNSYIFDTTVIEETRKLFSAPIDFKDYESLINKAEEICSDRFDIFALKGYEIMGKINYHMDNKSGLSAPSNVFGKSIDYRDSEKIGDIKYIWELNRHLFLVPLALAYHITGRIKYKEKFEYLLSEWIIQNPFMVGVNWTSSLELGIRLINWTICWHIIGESVNSELKLKWLDTIYRHCWFIDRNLSAFSSANNHLIGEVAGLFIGSVALPQFKASKKWTEKSQKILLRESEKQNYKDGVNKEQAISYQQFVLDFLILSGLSGEANNIKFSSKYWVTIENMLVYLAALEDDGGNIPHIGDEDDGFVIDVMQKEDGVYRSLLNTGAYLFKREEFLRKNITLDNRVMDNRNVDNECIDNESVGNENIHNKSIDNKSIDNKTQLLLNIGNIKLEEKMSKTELPDSFESGGYYILGTDFRTSLEQKLIFDCGDLGYLSLAAHGHADALAFNFSAGGVPIFIDPGTFAYHADKKWRNYFRSTGAHNTVRLDNKDQSIMSGNFMWSSKAKAEILEYKSLSKVKGRHDGYKNLKDSVIHEREVKILNDVNIWKIKDNIICQGKHRLELFFHIHPDCRVEEDGDLLKIYFSKGYCTLNTDKSLERQFFKGNEEIPLGWYSASYDVKVPSTTIRLSKEINGSTKVVTNFTIMFD